jgi:hypothetical protein
MDIYIIEHCKKMWKDLESTISRGAMEALEERKKKERKHKRR